MLRILVDNSVKHHAVSVKGERKSTGLQYWGGEIPVETGRIGSQLKLIETKQGCHGGAIAALAKKYTDGSIKLYTSDALRFETFHQPSGRFNGVNYGDFSLLSGVELEEIDSLDGFDFTIPGDDVTEKLREYIEQSQNSSFLEIRNSLPLKSSQDAWHIHCVEAYDLNYFLTADSTLISQIRSIPDCSLRQRILDLVILPSDLCDKLKITPLTADETLSFVKERGIFWR